MKNRLSMKDIIDMLASQYDIPKNDAEKFIVELFNVIESGLTTDESVTIEDFGTFKLTLIQERESMDVNTIEKTTIPSHRRISFIPDQTLESLVNKPFAHFETTLLNDGIVFENVKQNSFYEDNIHEDNDNIDDSTDELESTKTIDAIHDSACLTTNIQKSANDNIKEDSSAEVDSDDLFNSQIPDINQAENEAPLISNAIHPTNTANVTETKAKRSFSAWYIATPIFIVLLAFFTYNFYQIKNAPVKRDLEKSDVTKSIKETLPIVKDTLPQKVLAPIDSVETIKMEVGKTLRLIALDRYGSREFWVYIYLENKEKIKNPNVVPVGLEIVLPRKSDYDMNANSPESVVKAKNIGDEEMKKFR